MEKKLTFKRACHRVRVSCDNRQQHLRRPVRAVRALFPIPDRPKRKVEPLCELLLRQVQLLAQGAHGRDTTSPRERRLGRRRSISVGKRRSMRLLLAHGVKGAPIAFRRLLLIEPDTCPRSQHRSDNFSPDARREPALTIVIVTKSVKWSAPRALQARSSQCAPHPRTASAHVQRVAGGREGLPSSCFSRKRNRAMPRRFPVRLSPPARHRLAPQEFA